MKEEEALFHELFSGLPRLAPGLDSCTADALHLISLDGPVVAADLGCGVGLSTLVLAEYLEGTITAIDTHEPYLDSLKREANSWKLSGQIKAVCADMAEPPLERASLDLLWSEGAIYILGFVRGLELWKPFLKPGGWIALTELSWLTDNPSETVQSFWQEAYPGMTSVEGNLKQLQAAGFEPRHQFVLPDEAWEKEYYSPLEARMAEFKVRHAGNRAAEEIVAAVSKEIDVRRSHADEFSYVFYIAQLTDHD